MTTDQSDALLCSAITDVVQQCKEGKITTTELVERVQDIIDCGRALDDHRKRKENQNL